MSKKFIVSSDSHIVEPPELFVDRMDAAKYGERIPHLVHEDDNDYWYSDHKRMGVLGSFGASAGMRFERPGDIKREGRMSDILLGGYDPHAHVKDMDIDGVHANILYPSIGLEMFSVPDTLILREIFAAYNDWLSGFCSAYPDKLKGISMLLVDDEIEAAISDLHKAVDAGFAGVMISVFPKPEHSYDHPMYEPFWREAEQVGLPVSLHTGTERPSIAKESTAGGITQSGASRVNAEFWVRMSLAQIVLSGVFERYPKLNVVEVEHDLAWIPFFNNRMDTTYVERVTQSPYRYKSDALPSDYMRSNVYHSFQEDGLGVRDRDIIGVDKLLWGSDYPHAESTFPESQRILDEILEGVPEDEQAMIVGGNAARLYDLT